MEKRNYVTPEVQTENVMLVSMIAISGSGEIDPWKAKELDLSDLSIDAED